MPRRIYCLSCDLKLSDEAMRLVSLPDGFMMRLATDVNRLTLQQEKQRLVGYQ